MRTINEFKKDFAMELEEGMLKIGDVVSNETIFILRDGTIINAEFNEYGDRCTDHRQVLSDSRYSIDDLITIEPESQTVILPVNAVTTEQVESLQTIDEVYSDIEWLESNDNQANKTIELIRWLYDAEVTISRIFGIVKSGSFAELDGSELDDYDEIEKDELIYTESAVFEVWYN